MSEIFSHYKQVLKDKRYLLFFVFVFSVIYYFFEIFTYKELIIGNYGIKYYLIQVLSQALISLLFSLFLTLSVYKYVVFSTYSPKEGTTSFFATFIGILAAGCPACSITLASYIGLAGLIALLPYDGLEIKLLAIPMLVYANYSVSKNLTSCKLSKRVKKN